MRKKLWKTVCSEFVSNIAHLFLNLFENFKTRVAYKRLAYKKRASSNLIADRSNFLANKTARLILELCM